VKFQAYVATLKGMGLLRNFYGLQFWVVFSRWLVF